MEANLIPERRFPIPLIGKKGGRSRLRSVPDQPAEPIDLAAERAAYLARAAENGALHQGLFDVIEEKRQDRDWVVVQLKSGALLRLEEGYVGYTELAEVEIDGVTRFVKPTIQAERTVIGGQEQVEFRGCDYSAEWDQEREARNGQGPSEPIHPEELHVLRQVIEESTIVDFASGEQD